MMISLFEGSSLPCMVCQHSWVELHYGFVILVSFVPSFFTHLKYPNGFLWRKESFMDTPSAVFPQYMMLARSSVTKRPLAHS